MNLRTLFLNDLGRIRSGWRVVIFLIPFIFISICLSAAVSGALAAAAIDLENHHALVLGAGGLVTLVPAVLLGWLCGRLLEDLPFRALGCWFTSGWWKNLGVGCLVGSVSLAVAVVIAEVGGGLSFTFDITNSGDAIIESLAVSLAVFALAAAFEESLFRGYILQTLNRSRLGWLAIALTAIFFGLVHLGNPGANAISTANTMLAGVWFGVAYLKTRDLWFPFGIHLVWNWMQGSVFGIEVSGLTDISRAPVLNEIDRGPAWLTGEHYGIEASIACTIAILMSIALIYLLPGIRPSDEMLALTENEKPKPASV